MEKFQILNPPGSFPKILDLPWFTWLSPSFSHVLLPKKNGGANSTLQDSTLAVLGTSAACWCALRAGRCALSEWWLLVVETCFSIGRFWETGWIKLPKYLWNPGWSPRRSCGAAMNRRPFQIQRSTMLWILVGLHPTWPMALLVAWLWHEFFWRLNAQLKQTHSVKIWTSFR